MALADNTEALMGGFQIGNTWAAQHSRNREARDRRDMAQTELAARFGDDTVFGKDGKVDVFGSAAKKRIREEARIRAEAEGTLRAWDDSPIGPKQAQPAPAAPFTPLEPGDPGMSGSQMMPSPEDFPMGPPPAAAPVAGVAAPVAAPTNRLQIPEEIAGNPYALGAFARQREQVAQERRLTAEQARRTKAEEMARQADIYQRYGPSVVTGPDGEVDIPASAQAAEKRRADQARNLAMGEYNALNEVNGPMTEEQANSAEFMAGQNKGSAKRLPIDSRENIVNLNNQARADRDADLIASRENIQRMRGEQATATYKPVKMEVFDKTLSTQLAGVEVNKRLAIQQLENTLKVATDESIPFPVRIATAKMSFKTLNSSDYKSDAVSGPEEKRIGGLLGFEFNPVRGWLEVGHITPDLPGFIQQVQLKVDSLKKEADQNHQQVQKIYQKYGVNIDDPKVGQPTGTAPSSASVTQALVDSKPAVPAIPADSVLMTDPKGNKVAVPKSREAEVRQKYGYK